jgi:antitoxin component YwqK of YwqJK toxin-antitoxin module
MRTLILIFIILISLPVLAQDTTTFYYDSKWQLTQSKETASYYGKMWKNSQGTYTAFDYYMNGSTQMTGVYKSMKTKVKHGLFSYYTENGIKEVEGQYFENMEQGDWKYWDENGKLTGILSFKDGKMIREQIFHHNGNLKHTGSVKNGMKSGTWQYWDSNGRLIFEGQYLKGARTGDWNRYLPDTTITVKYMKGILLEDTGSLIRNRDQGRRIYNN